MKVSLKMKLLTLAASLGMLVMSCSKKDGPEGPADNGFDKTAMLTHYADGLIIPGYSSLQQKLQELETPLQAFMDDPTAANQQLLKAPFKEAYLQFERISVYQIGPAETILLNNFLNTFPVNYSAIENGILYNSIELRPNFAINLQGFPALDYLLFSNQALEQLAGPTAANRKLYVQAVFDRMKALVNEVVSEWKGGYRAQFIANTRTDVGSSIGYLVNQLAYEMDQMKGPRIGWPFGKQSGGQVFADKTEAYYSGLSMALAIENLKSLKTAYTGGSDGKGLSGYLVALKKESLNTEVIRQFDVTIEKLMAIPDPLSTSLSTHSTQVNDAYKEIQNLLTLIKTDVASATAVRITYQDSDGD